ncbi:hypothetical protein OH76DRAFT_659162 [Lentinus brumalis]|uniref:Uncharacterized protein n=1 Tax=Lentinus brumalis TaxID=2498619 RepID=A0A371D7L5_9APHY|nr:hypothetical protein OH76DRAFT_659162 [Polyporus brumalis]
MLAWPVYCRRCSHAILANSAQFFTPPFRRIRAPGPRISVNFTLATTLGLSATCSVCKRFPNTGSHPPTRAPQSTTIPRHGTPTVTLLSKTSGPIPPSRICRNLLAVCEPRMRTAEHREHCSPGRFFMFKRVQCEQSLHV